MALSEEKTIGIKCIKYLLCLSNFAFVITALLIISIGTTIFAQLNNFSEFFENSYFSPSLYLIIIGLVLLIVSLFGFVGALKESTCMITTFSAILVVILTLELAVVLIAFIGPNGVDTFIDDSLRDAMKHYNDSTEDTAVLDYLHTTMNCCGVNSYHDWDIYGAYPQTCCAYIINKNGKAFCGLDLVRKEGCLPRLKMMLNQSSFIISSMGLTTALVQALGICFAFILGRSIRRAKTEREMRRIAFRSQFINANNYDNPPPKKFKTTVLYTPTSSDA